MSLVESRVSDTTWLGDVGPITDAAMAAPGVRFLAKAGGQLDVILNKIIIDVALDDGSDQPWGD
jgi:hypothetical protein